MSTTPTLVSLSALTNEQLLEHYGQFVALVAIVSNHRLEKARKGDRRKPSPQTSQLQLDPASMASVLQQVLKPEEHQAYNLLREELLQRMES